MRNFTVQARDTDFTNLGAIDAYNALSVVPRFNAVGSWSLTYRADSRAAGLLAAGGGIQITRRGSTTPVITGPVGVIAESLDSSRKIPLLTFSGPCDNIYLAARLCYPVPGNALSAQTSAYDIRSGAAETVMKQYVNLNLGPGALAARRAAGLTVETDAARGATAGYSARFDTLLTVLQALAVTGHLGFQVQQVGTGLVFSVYVPSDRSGYVRFSTKTASLGGYAYTLTAPTGTSAIVGDANTSTGRAFTTYTNTVAESDWAIRYEVFADQANTVDGAQLAQAGAQALDAGSPQAQVTFAPIDTPQRSFGLDYHLGDTVTVELGTNAVVDVVREVLLTDDVSTGVQVSPTVGGSQAAGPSTNSAIYKALRYLGVAVGRLQRRR